MRKLFVLILFATSLAFVQPSVAQVNFGFRGGLNISNMSLDEDVLNVSNRAGFFFGPTLKLGFGFLGADIAALYDLREAKVDGETWPAMLNIGFRPTFEGKARTIEAHLLGFDRDIYFHELTLEFVDFLRPERRFESPQELAAQLEADRNKVRQTIKLG